MANGNGKKNKPKMTLPDGSINPKWTAIYGTDQSKSGPLAPAQISTPAKGKPKKTRLLDIVEKYETKLKKTNLFIDAMLENRTKMEYAEAGSGQSAESNKSISEAQSPLVYYDPAYEKKKKQMGL